MMHEIALHESVRPFSECCSECGMLSQYWSNIVDQYESEMACPPNAPNEDHYEILQNHYDRFSNGFKNTQLGVETYFDDLRDDFEEYNLNRIYAVADIYLAARCAYCEDKHHCWANDFSFEDFQRKETLTDFGKEVFDGCFDDEMSSVCDSIWWGVEYFILQLVKECGYSLPIDGANAASLFTKDYNRAVLYFARKTVMYNDCQTLLFPQFASDFGIVGKTQEPLLLTG